MMARRNEEEERRIGSVMEQVDMFMRVVPQLLTEKLPFLELPPAYKVN